MPFDPNILGNLQNEIARLRKTPSVHHPPFDLPPLAHPEHLSRLHEALARLEQSARPPRSGWKRRLPKFFWPLFRNQGRTNHAIATALDALTEEIQLLRTELSEHRGYLERLHQRLPNYHQGPPHTSPEPSAET